MEEKGKQKRSSIPNLRLVSAPLECLAARDEDGIALHLVPMKDSHVEIENTDQPASISSCYTRSCLVVASTPFHTSSIVEIRTYLLHSSEVNEAPQHILFPAPLLEGISILPGDEDTDTNTVMLQAVTITGYVYRLQIPLHMLHSFDNVPAKWVVEHKFSSIGNDAQALVRDKTLSSCHVSEDGNLVLVACSDGRIIKFSWEKYSKDSDETSVLSGAWHESVLQAQTFFSRFFTRSSSLSPQIHSISSWANLLGFVVSQDRKLRIWDFSTSSCIRVVDLPSSASHTSTDENTQMTENDPMSGQSSTLPFAKHAMVRAFARTKTDSSSAYGLYIIVYIPAPLPSGDFIACYGLQIESPSSSSHRLYSGAVGDLDLLWQKKCQLQVSRSDHELRDISLVFREGLIDLWCLWDAVGTTSIQILSIDVHKAAALKQHSWRSVALPCSYSPLQGVALDEDLSTLTGAQEMAPFMAQRILEPNRFSRGCLEYGLESYEELLSASGQDIQAFLPRASSLDGLYEQIVRLVGSSVELQLDNKTGAPLHDEYFASLKREWSTFVGLLEEYDARERWPIGFATGAEDADVPFLITRGTIALPVLEDSLSVSWRISKMSSVEPGLPHDIRFGHEIFKSIHPQSWKDFEDELFSSLTMQVTEPIENVARYAWDKYVDDDILERWSEISRDGVPQVESLQRNIFNALRQFGKPNASLLPSVGSPPTELSAVLCADDLSQLVADRLNLARILLILSLALTHDLLGEIDQESEAYSSLVVESAVVYHHFYALDQLGHKEGLSQITVREPQLDEEADAYSVTKQIDEMQFASRSEDEAVHIDGLATNLIHLGVIHGYLRGRTKEQSTISSSVSELAKTILDSISPEIHGLTSLVRMDKDLIRLAHHTVLEGHPVEALAFVRLFPVTYSSSYISARCLLLMKDWEQAAHYLDSIAPFFTQSQQSSKSTDSTPFDILPSLVKDAATGEQSLLQFYRLAVMYFHQAHIPEFVVHFAESATSLIASGTQASSFTIRALYLALFQNCLGMEAFDDAYIHLLSIPFDDLQRECLRSLVSVMCEKGYTQKLLHYNFAGLQAEVERSLSFKARNSDPFDGVVNYYDILYAFHLQRGDLKSAGATMWQMGKRFSDMAKHRVVSSHKTRLADDGSVLSENAEMLQYVVLEARSYLKSINVLSLINPADAWFAYEMSSDEDTEELVDSSRLTSYIPATSFHQQTREIRIVQLNDVKRQYQVLVAHLELMAIYPDTVMPMSASSKGNIATFILLFARNQDYERAFSFALSVQADRTQVFTSLTDRCLELALWAQTRAQRNEAAGHEKVHPLMQALYDDQDLSPDELTFDFRNDQTLTAPQARFLDRSDRCVAWQGSPSARAWRYLRYWLSMEDTNGPDARYRVVVLDHVLARQQWSLTPEWLLSWMRQHQPDLLVKLLMDHDLVLPALNEALGLVQRSTLHVTNSRKRARPGSTAFASETWLPYLVFDELLKRASEPLSLKQNESLSECREMASRLSEAIEKRKEEFRRIEADIQRTRREDNVFQRRQAQRHENAKDVDMS